MYQYKRQDKMYLEDQPMISKTIRSWLEGIELRSDAYEHDLAELECKSRDGFFAAGHNCGGFDKTWQTDVFQCYASGQEFGLDIEGAMKINLDMATEELKRNGITDPEKIQQEADEYAMNDTVWVGVRCMYEGIESGVHTLMVYCSSNQCEYYGPHGKGSGTLAEFEIRFKTASGLRRQLADIKNKVQNSFE